MPGIATIRLYWKPTATSYSAAKLKDLQTAFDAVYPRATRRSLQTLIVNEDISDDAGWITLVQRLDAFLATHKIGEYPIGHVTHDQTDAVDDRWKDWNGDLHDRDRHLLLEGNPWTLTLEEGAVEAEVIANYQYRVGVVLPLLPES